MIQYPSIPGWKYVSLGRPCYAFYKYDGSNLRFEWSPKKGWHKFGTRTQLFNSDTDLYNQSLPFFFNNISDVLVSKVCKMLGYKPERIVAFAEFYGDSSFAGTHLIDEAKILKLFDVSIYKQGFLDARTYLKLFDAFEHSAELVYTGNMSKSFVEQVKGGILSLNEGVVCKGNDWAAKIKTEAYLTKLKNYVGPSWKDEGE